MKKKISYLEDARVVLKTEAEGIIGLLSQLNDSFDEAVQLIGTSKGRVILTGIGKSAIIANKISATLNSTGTPSAFMHAADAIHGDLGTITQKDVVLCISKSGNTPEIKALCPLIRQGKNKLIALCGSADSYLARHADLLLLCQTEREACPHDLAPTTSTTAQLALGDALAVALLKYHGFKAQDFAKNHPGGSLGKKLYLRTSDLSKINAKPFVAPDANLKEVILAISSGRLGAVVVLKNQLAMGIITDGDIRRAFEHFEKGKKVKASDLMNAHPKTIDADTLALEALEIMKKHSVSQLIVTKKNRFEGFIHMHDLIREGLL